jgi:hypothetical protein
MAGSLRAVLDDQGMSANVSVRAFTTAVIASGDVCYYDPGLVGKGGVLCLGLADSGTGRRARNEWLRVLETGRPREPLPAPSPYADWRPGYHHGKPTTALDGGGGPAPSGSGIKFRSPRS